MPQRKTPATPPPDDQAPADTGRPRPGESELGMRQRIRDEKQAAQAPQRRRSVIMWIRGTDLEERQNRRDTQ